MRTLNAEDGRSGAPSPVGSLAEPASRRTTGPPTSDVSDIVERLHKDGRMRGICGLYRASSLAALLFGVLGAWVVAGCASGQVTQPAGRPTAVAAKPAAVWALSDRGIKTQLIMDMRTAPGVLVIGGSRALRVEPKYIHRLTGLTAFNAAVTHATPQDEWCFVSLLHSRFPKARFGLLWVIHCDEFDEFSPGAALLEDPFLSQFLPEPFVDGTLDRLGPAANTALALGARHPSIIATDGFTLSDSISAAATRGSLRDRVNRWIKSTLRFYHHTPAHIGAQSAYYFTMTLRLMNRLGVSPVIVLAPLQPRYLATISNPGWEARHRQVLAYLHRLQLTYRFNILDFSRIASIGASSTGFYDAVHMRPQTARLLVSAVLHALPGAFASPRALKS